MADTAPFPGIMYDARRLKIENVIAPPYDVLSPTQQEEYYRRDPYNFVRIMLNKEEAGDGDTANRYTRAAGFLRSWLAEGALQQDARPAYYEYVQNFEHPLHPNEIVARRTLFVALKLQPYENGVVLPHEETHPKAKADRMELMRATEANPEPIYGLYEDPELKVAHLLEQSRNGAAPVIRAVFPGTTAPDAEQHLIYRHEDPALIQGITQFFSPLRVWIADGHHRYETALNYQKERRDARGSGEDAPWDYLLIGLSAFEDPGLVVLPTHRLIKNVSQARIDSLQLQLERYFFVQPMTHEKARKWIKEEGARQRRFVVLTESAALGLSLRDIRIAEEAAGSAHCEAWKRLDVTILQGLVLDRTLGISWTTLAHTPDVAYTRDEEEAVQKVISGEFQIACLLQNPTVTEVRDVAAAGDKMPQKSTFFYPKLWSGLVIRSLADGQV